MKIAIWDSVTGKPLGITSGEPDNIKRALKALIMLDGQPTRVLDNTEYAWHMSIVSLPDLSEFDTNVPNAARI